MGRDRVDLRPYAPPPGGTSTTEVVAGLRPGNVFVLEAYRPEQLDYGTGGPPTAELMMRLDALRAELAGLEFDLAAETTRNIREGTHASRPGRHGQILAHKPE